MKSAFIFDVDGTLTPSRQKMDQEFQKDFLEFCKKNDVYLITGADRSKTLEQIGKQIYDFCAGIWQCNGNEFWNQNLLLKKNTWQIPYKLEKYLVNFVYKSKYPVKIGRHIEVRTGMINFSVVGRNANEQQRLDYFNWDKENKEREKIIYELGKKHPDLTVCIGGMVSVDIYPKGADKSQAMEDLKEYDTIHFFGDHIEDKGNDYTLALVIELSQKGKAYQVSDWKDTWNRIKNHE
jgi:phosphomannomutase